MARSRPSPKKTAVASVKRSELTKDSDRATLVHDLHVHQEELHVQNQQLIAAQTALEETRDRFVDLYDFAPNGYLTVDKDALILQINLTGAAFFGRSRDAIVGLPLLAFVARQERGEFLDFMRACRGHRSGPGPVVELAARTADGVRHMQLICRPWKDHAGTREFFMAVLDITDRKLADADREVAAREHAELVGRLLSVQEDERRRIARDIHDHLGQQLTGLRLKLEQLGGDPAAAGLRERILDVHRIAEQLDTHLDFFTGKLRPAALDDLGLVVALSQFVNAWSANFGVLGEFQSSGLDGHRIVPEVETHLYRFCQEALHNVYKHAMARRASVILARRHNQLILIVEDDGRGFDPQAPRKQPQEGGLGLLGMRERAALMGGKVDIESKRGKGTTLFLQVPWSIASPPPRKILNSPRTTKLVR